MFCAGNLNALLKLHLQFECFVYELCYQGRSQKKKLTEAMSVKNSRVRQSVQG